MVFAYTWHLVLLLYHLLFHWVKSQTEDKQTSVMQLVNSFLRNYIKILHIPQSGPKWLLAITSLIIPWSKSYWKTQSYHSLPTSAAEIVNSCNMSNRRGIVSLISHLSLCIHYTFCKRGIVMFSLLWILTYKGGNDVCMNLGFFLHSCAAQKFVAVLYCARCLQMWKNNLIF